MFKLETKMKGQQLAFPTSSKEADEVYDKVKHVIELDDVTKKARKRRKTQLGWKYHARIHRDKDKTLKE